MKKMFRSFKYALNGIIYCMKGERNFRIQLLCALCVTAAGFILKISTGEWLVILVSFSMVLSFEMINSSIEHLCNHVQSEHHVNIRIIKDISAGAVLLSSLLTAVCGGIIFIPKLLKFYNLS